MFLSNNFNFKKT